MSDLQKAAQQEPVAWALHTGTKQGIKWNRRVEHGTPLYAAPQHRPLLTDEEVRELLAIAKSHAQTWLMFARAIERKVRGEE